MRNHKPKLIVLGLVILLLSVVVFVLKNCCLLNHGVDVKSATLFFKNGNARLNADIDFQFSKTAITALDNGVSLPFDVEVVVKSQRDWLWNKTEWHATLAYQLRYLALSKSYELINESSSSRREFASRGSAIEALGIIRGMPVAKSFCSSAIDQCQLLIRVTLNRERLPLPLRPVAYLSLDWYLSSWWKQWPLTS